MATRKSKKIYAGWSRYGRPFTPTEFKKAHISGSFNNSYSQYLKEYGRQYKNPTLRKGLLK